MDVEIACGCHPPTPWEPACDEPEYPPAGKVRVCARHGVDPCHDDMWHFNNDPVVDQGTDG